MVAAIPLNCLYSQNTQRPTRQSSFEAFSQGDYEKAYAQFKELLLTYSKDPLYKYYSGVCLIKLKRAPSEAADLLQQALDGAGSIKTLPSDGLFYLGRARQMAGKFSEAEEAYNSYTKAVGKKESKSNGVPDLIQQCRQKKGQLPEAEVKPPLVLKTEKPDSVKNEKVPVIKESIPKPAQKSVTQKSKLPVNYENILNEAIEFQYKADSVTSLVNSQKKDLDKLSGNSKDELKTKIAENEKKAASLQAIADVKYHEAKGAMPPEKDSVIYNSQKIAQSRFKLDNDSGKNLNNNAAKSIKKQADSSKAITKQRDTSKVVIKPQGTVKTISQVEPAKPINKPVETTSGVNQQVEIFAFFDVSKAPDPAAKIVIDPEVPPGLIYRIQIAVFRNAVLPSYFKGITPVYGFKVEGTDKISYYVGMFRKSFDAAKAVTAVKNKGFRDAFVVPLFENKRVSADRAASLEREWGTKPFYSIEKSIQKTATDTITPTLTFRVDVIRSPKPLTEDVVEGIRKMAGNRGLDIQQGDDGKIDYLIGKFITFETASEYADLLKKNGYREAQVAAWLGKKEIPVDTARKLIDNLK